MGFYDEMALMAQDMTKTFKTGDVQLRRVTSVLQGPDIEYNPIATVIDIYDLDSVVIGVSADYVDGDMVKFDDLQVITSPFFRKDGVQVQIEPKMSDEIYMHGETHVIKKIERVPANGTVSTYLIFISS